MKFSLADSKPVRRLVGVIPAPGNRMIINNKDGSGRLIVLQNGKARNFTGGVTTLEKIHKGLHNSTPVYEGDTVEVTF